MRKSRRRGSQLIEIMMVMSVASPLLVLSMQLIHRGMSSSSEHQRRIDHLRSTELCSRQFRNDVHRALGGETEVDGGLTLNLPDRTRIRYVAGDQRLVRTVTGADGSQQAHEAYTFAEGRTANFTKLNAPDRIVLEIAHALPPDGADQRLDIRAEAVMAKLYGGRSRSDNPDTLSEAASEAASEDAFAPSSETPEELP
jgi:hypothetical protein